MRESAPPLENRGVPGLRFVKRMFAMRILGTFFCFFPILSVLDELGRPALLIVLLAINAFIWPVVAWLLARRAAAPLAAEHRNLIVDAGAGGFWVAVMAVNPLPSVVIVTLLLTDRLAAGGAPLLRRAVLAMLTAFVVCWLALDLPVQLYVTQRTMLATLPLIAVYLLALSMLTHDIAARLRRKSDELERIAMQDPLLDIANRRLLERRMTTELNRMRQRRCRSVLMFIDLDNFKEVNDRYGHKVGDTMLGIVSQILTMVSREGDTPARLGGDEFVLLLPDTRGEEAALIASRIMDAAAAMAVLPDATLTLSIGIATAGPEVQDVGAWLKLADDALYEAKRRGKNQVFAC